MVEKIGFADLPHLYTLRARDYTELFGVPLAQAHSLMEGLADAQLLEVELENIQKHNVEWTTSFDDDYPTALKDIYLPPVVLYWRGKHPASYLKNVAFIGARKANSYAIRAARLLIPSLVQHGWNIISGGARGADAYAHQVAIESEGATLAVLGCGLLVRYCCK